MLSRFLSSISLLFVINNALISCGGLVQKVLVGETMGTVYTVKYLENSEADLRVNHESLHEDIEGYLENFNEIFSTYISDSEISLINQSDDVSKAAGIEITPEFEKVLSRALKISSQSQGYFDPTVYPLVALWKEHFKQGLSGLPEKEDIEEAKSQVGYGLVELKSGKVFMGKGVSIDLSAIAKGSGVDGIADILEERGIDNYLVEIGGEIRVKGLNQLGNPWRIAIAPPMNDDMADITSGSQGGVEKVVLPLSSGAMATSGDYFNFFVYQGVKYSHLIDPHTGMPIRHYVTSVSVIANTCEEADAWATALIVMGEGGMAFSEREGIPAIFMVSDDDDKIRVVKNSWVDSYLK